MLTKSTGVRRFYKILSVALTVAMLIGLLPSGVFAAGDTTKGSIQQVVHQNGDSGPISYFDVNIDGTAGDVQTSEWNQSRADDPKVRVSKTITGTSDENVFDITLDVWTKQDLTKPSVPVNKDAAVVLVLDISGSMGNSDERHPGGSEPLPDGSSRIQAAVAAAKQFVKDYRNPEYGTGARWLQIVHFARNAATQRTQWVNVANYSDEQINTLIGNPGASTTSGTNIEGALRMAYNLYGTSGNRTFGTNVQNAASITNRYTILLTDGKPTTYNQTQNNTATDTINGNDPTGITEQSAANRALTAANQLKTRSAIYSISFAAANEKVNGQPLSQWLATFSTSLSSENKNELFANFVNIVKSMSLRTQAWMVNDPMGRFIEFADTNDVTKVTANPSDDPEKYFNTTSNTLRWNLAKTASTLEDGWNKYSYPYSIRLTTEAFGFEFEPTSYLTNGHTTLTYSFVEYDNEDKFVCYTDEDGTPITVNEIKSINFFVPKVFGYKANLNFTKVEKGKTAPIDGAQFELEKQIGPSSEDWTTVGEGPIAGDKGVFEFNNLTNGNYRLTETTVPTGYKDENTVYGFEVSYGNIVPDDKITGATTALPSKNGKTLYIENTPLAPGVYIEKSADKDEIAAGSADAYRTVNYTLTVTNTGDTDLRNIVIEDAFDLDGIDGDLVYADADDFSAVQYNKDDESQGSVSLNEKLTINNNDGSFTIDLGSSVSLTPGDYIIVEYSVVFPANNSESSVDWVNEATVSATDGNKAVSGEPDSATVTQDYIRYSAELTKEVYSINGAEVGDLPDESKTDAGTPYVEAGDDVVYKVTITNTGNQALTLTAINDELEGVTGPYASADDAATGDETKIVNEFSSIAAGGTGEYDVAYYFRYVVPNDISDGYVVTNTATAVTEEELEDDPTDTVDIVAKAPNISVSKSLISAPAGSTEGGTPLFQHGATVVFEVTITNSGNADATDVSFADAITSDGGNSFDLDDAQILSVVNGNVDVTDTVDLGELTVAAGTNCVIQYEYTLPGQTDEDYADKIAELTGAVQDEADKLQAVIDNAHQAILDQEALIFELEYKTAPEIEAWLNEATLALAEADVPEYNALGELILEKSAAYLAAAESVEEYTAMLQELRSSTLESLKEALAEKQAYYDALASETSAEGIAARADLVRAQSALADYVAQGEQFEIYEYKNTASYYGQSDDVTVAIDFDKEPLLTVQKQVRAGKETAWSAWSDYVRIADGQDVEFRILVKNIGNAATSGSAILSDNFAGADLINSITLPSIPAGVTATILINANEYRIDFSDESYSAGRSLANSYSNLLLNDNYNKAAVRTNAATLTYNYGEEGETPVTQTDTANVVVPPKKVPVLSIEKLVRVATGGDAFTKTKVVSALEPVTFEFQIIVKNTGEAAAIGVDVIDELLADFAPMGDFDGNIQANGEAVFTGTVTLAPGEDITNWAFVETEEDAIIIKGEDWAYAKVNSVPHSALKVEKYVAQGPNGGTGDGYVWTKDALFYSASPVDVLFKIVVTNDSDVPGMFSLEDVLTADGTTENPIALNALSLDPSGNTGATEANLTVSGTQVFYYIAKNVTPNSSLTNEVWIAGDRAPNAAEAYDTVVDGWDYASATARVVNNPTLTMEKYIIAGSYDASSDTADANLAWLKNGSVTVSAGSTANVTYKIVLTVQGIAKALAESGASGIDITLSDTLDDEDINLVPGNTLRVSQDGTYVFYVQRALGAGVHTNVVSALADDSSLEFTVDDDNAESSATYTITEEATSYGGGGGGGAGTPPPIVEEEIEDEATPLADMVLPELDDDEVFILDEDTPLADLPQTGATVPAAGSGATQGAGGANAVLPTKGRRDDDRGATV